MHKTICFFNPTKTWGGGEKWHFEMAAYLHKKQYKILVIVTENSILHKKLKDKKIPTETIYTSKSSFLNPLKIKKVAYFLEKYSVNIMVLNSSSDMKLGGLAARKVGIDRIIYRRGSAIPIKNTFVNRYFFKNIITEVLANSEATKATINANNALLFPKEKITVIPNGINISKFKNTLSSSIYKKEHDEIVLGNLGRMVYQKNQEFLIDVGLELKKRALNFKVLIGGIGKLESTVNEKVIKNSLTDSIKLLGFIDNPKSFMQSIDIFLLPSRWEGFGYVIAEAMLCKKPVIAFDISSNSQLIEHEKNGFLVDFNNVKSFCDAIEIFYKNPSKSKEMGEKGAEKIETKFNSILIQERVEAYLAS